MLVIPAIDLRDGKCVRLKQGDYAQQVANDLKEAGFRVGADLRNEKIGFKKIRGNCI